MPEPVQLPYLNDGAPFIPKLNDDDLGAHVQALQVALASRLASDWFQAQADFVERALSREMHLATPISESLTIDEIGEAFDHIIQWAVANQFEEAAQLENLAQDKRKLAQQMNTWRGSPIGRFEYVRL